MGPGAFYLMFFFLCALLLRFFFFPSEEMAANPSRDIPHITIKFDGTNFPSWRYGIWLILEKAKLTTIVNGTEPMPVEVSFFLTVLCCASYGTRAPCV